MNTQNQSYQQNAKKCWRAVLYVSLAVGLGACGGEDISSEEQEPDPVVVDVPIAVIKRDLSVEGADQQRSIGEPALFVPGASLVLKARASASAVEVDLTESIFADRVDEEGNRLPIDIKDLESSYDGSRLIFSMRAPEDEDADDDEQPTWNIWEYILETQELRRVIGSDIVAEAGEDTGPIYLADGRILFSSTRQRGNQAVLLDEGKPQYNGLEEGLDVHASVLHIMDANGENIQQISYNQSHDLDPLVAPNGKIIFSRWDQLSGNKGVHLYQINPDGSDLEILYGRHSHVDSNGDNADIHFTQTRVTPDGRILVALTPFEKDELGTDFVSVDVDNYIDNFMPIASAESLSGPAQEKALFENIDIEADISPGGYIAALYPLFDGSGRQLFSWSQCRLLAPLAEDAEVDAERQIAPCTEENLADDNFEQAPSLYGLWMFDPVEGTQLPLVVPQENVAYSEVVAVEDRPFPADPQSTIDSADTGLIDAGMGIIHIRSVYDFAGEDRSPAGLINMADPTQVTPDERPARFLRVVKSVSIPDDDTLDLDNSAFGRSRNELMREILGYTPIQPDGSVKVAVPANLPFAISVVDADGRRISARHENWLQVAPGETKTCSGCHDGNTRNAVALMPHGRSDAETESINLGAPSTGVPFPNTNPALFADIGETMAETFTRINGVPNLNPDIIFEDVWTDPAVQTPAESYQLRYADIPTPQVEEGATAPRTIPISVSCGLTWTSICRSVVNFPDHIQPLFDLDRSVVDDMGMVVSDTTCASCHNRFDADNELQVPAGQLELTSNPSPVNADLLTSYRELMFNDVELEIIDGALLPRLIPVFDNNGDPVFEVDEEGELILDAEGNPIQVTQQVTVTSSMRTAGANASGRFFAPFEEGGSHQGWLSPAELRLISEWLDVGGQNYNNPFDAPAN
ncbi:PD40 domain-containing protein [Glaciecola sp. MH2013]|uniref:HzsA-related protein n=1 Tax=Glaciecola sp. MH2013 TaxID=2785524 RepID=UPI00189E1BCC|nr:PD40 domain-containing protein [Glaciecola sp. MH2013]MBF7074555.1 PD40 domain-containing protein [Glaciecola sp. MH2013]